MPGLYGNYNNIERRAFRRGQYTGYAAGAVFIIERETANLWRARWLPGSTEPTKHFQLAPTLAAMSARLREIADAMEGNK